MIEPEKQGQNASHCEERLEQFRRGHRWLKKIALTAVVFAGVSLLLRPTIRRRWHAYE